MISSPDSYTAHIDGIGDATSNVSKYVVLLKSNQPSHDTGYLYGQVSINKPLADWGGSCGGLSTGVGALTLRTGLMDPARIPGDDICEVCIW